MRRKPLTRTYRKSGYKVEAWTYLDGDVFIRCIDGGMRCTAKISARAAKALGKALLKWGEGE